MNVLPTTIIVTTVFTLVALAVLALWVYRRAKVIHGDLTQLRDRVLPDLERLQRDADIASREWSRVEESASRIGDRTGSHTPRSRPRASDRSPDGT